MSVIPPAELCPRLDLMLLTPVSSQTAETAFRWAKDCGLRSVMVPSTLIALAQAELANSGVRVVTVIDHPHGLSALAEKKVVISRATGIQPTHELGVVLNPMPMLDGHLDSARGELRLLKQCAPRNHQVCAMFDMSLLPGTSQREEYADAIGQEGVDWIQPHVGVRHQGRISLTALEELTMLRRVANRHSKPFKIRAYAGLLSVWDVVGRMTELADSVAIDWRPAFSA